MSFNQTSDITVLDLIPNECSEEYNTFWEAVIYLVTLIYLGIGLFLHISVIRIVMFKERKHFENNSFFKIIVMDSLASVVSICVELFFNRPLIYITLLCSIIGPYFWSPSVLLTTIFVTLNHVRFAKSISQIAMVLNRMSCVLVPMNYEKAWKILTPISCFFIFFLPFGGTWNVIISRNFLQPLRGGFTVGYLKTVRWAALSLFQSIYILTALFFTVVCSSVTFFKLFFLPDRIKSAEKSLCFTSVFISSTFLMVAATQLSFAFCLSCDKTIQYLLQSLAFDAFTVGPAVIIIATSKQIRSALFSAGKPKKKVSVVSVSGRLSAL